MWFDTSYAQLVGKQIQPSFFQENSKYIKYAIFLGFMGFSVWALHLQYPLSFLPGSTEFPCYLPLFCLYFSTLCRYHWSHGF